MDSISAAGVGRDRALTVAMCVACACSVSAFGSYPALLPRLFAAGLVSTREATFVNAAFFAGYMLVAPLATSLTDRVDARRLVLPAHALGALSSLAFAALAQHFAAALVTRALAGACVAAGFMPGLRALTDRLPTGGSARFVGFYMSSFALGTSLSYVLCELVASRLGSTAALYATSAGPLCAWFAASVLRPVARAPSPRVSFFTQLRPLFAMRDVLLLVCAYGLHCAELFALRSWCVAFLAAVDARQRFSPPFWFAPATVVAVANVLTAPASVLGSELALKVGGQRYIALTLTLSPVCFGLLGFVHDTSAWLAGCAVLACAMVLGADSAAITSRLVQAAPLAQRGISMALHTAVGFLGALLGPTLLGLMLDARGGPEYASAWQWAFASVGALSLLGSSLLLRRARRDVAREGRDE